MIPENPNDYFKIQMSQADFNRLSNFINQEYGIKLPPSKHIMLQSRLHKRLRELRMRNFKDYIDYVFSQQGRSTELIHMIDVVSTNKTDFFREPSHFEFMNRVLLPRVAAENPRAFLRVWSAGCSSGEEPYTIAMVLSEFRAAHNGLDFHILGTDISTQVLQAAANATYKMDKVEPVPLELKRKYMLKSKDKDNPQARMAPSIRAKVTFERLNFMDPAYQVGAPFDIIFCRNVLIYFERDVQEQVILKLADRLKPGGTFFMGHSESITNMKVPLAQIQPTIFRRT